MLRKGLAPLLAFAVAATFAGTGLQAAEPLSMRSGSVLIRPNGPILPLRAEASEPPARLHAASLFAGRDGASLFAHPPVRASLPAGASGLAASLSLWTGNAEAQAMRVRHVIGAAEAGRMGYDAVVFAAKILPPRRPTQLTIGEINDWVAATPGQHHAIGRYQFIPKTFRRLTRELGISDRTRFSPQVQDHMANLLLAEAGLAQLRAGEISRHAFMYNLSRIWAGLPTSSGKSYYHGHAGNRATMSWAQFDTAMAQIFPD